MDGYLIFFIFGLEQNEVGNDEVKFDVDADDDAVVAAKGDMKEWLDDNPPCHLKIRCLYCVVLQNLVMRHQTTCWWLGLMDSLSMKPMACMDCSTVRPVFNANF